MSLPSFPTIDPPIEREDAVNQIPPGPPERAKLPPAKAGGSSITTNPKEARPW